MSAILGVHTRTLAEWVERKGCPVLRRGTQGVEAIYDTRDVIEWFAEFEIKKRFGDDGAADGERLNPQQQKARYDKSRADAQEMKNWLTRRMMVLVDDVVRVVTEQYGQVRSKLMEMPGRLAQELALEGDPALVERRLKDEVVAALAALNPGETVDPAA